MKYDIKYSIIGYVEYSKYTIYIQYMVSNGCKINTSKRYKIVYIK